MKDLGTVLKALRPFRPAARRVRALDGGCGVPVRLLDVERRPAHLPHPTVGGLWWDRCVHEEQRAAEQRVLAHRAGPLLVLGGPGTGKTSLVVELAAARVRAGLDPAQLLVLAPSRGAAGELRDRVAARRVMPGFTLWRSM